MTISSSSSRIILDRVEFAKAASAVIADADADEAVLPTIASIPEARDNFEKQYESSKALTRDRLASIVDVKQVPLGIDYKMMILYALGAGMHVGGAIALHTLARASAPSGFRPASSAPASAPAPPGSVGGARSGSSTGTVAGSTEGAAGFTPAGLTSGSTPRDSIDHYNQMVEEAAFDLHAQAQDPVVRAQLEETKQEGLEGIPYIFADMLGSKPDNVKGYQDALLAVYYVGLAMGTLHSVLLLHPPSEG
jgi:hypothetical protein